MPLPAAVALVPATACTTPVAGRVVPGADAPPVAGVDAAGSADVVAPGATCPVGGASEVFWPLQAAANMSAVVGPRENRVERVMSMANRMQGGGRRRSRVNVPHPEAAHWEQELTVRHGAGSLT